MYCGWRRWFPVSWRSVFCSARPAQRSQRPPTPTPAARVHLPLILKPAGSVSSACPTSSTNSYARDRPTRRSGQSGATGGCACGQELRAARLCGEHRLRAAPRAGRLRHRRPDPAAAARHAVLAQPRPAARRLLSRPRLELESVSRSRQPRRAADAVAGDGVGIAGVARRDAARADIRLRHRPGLRGHRAARR